MLTQPTWCIRAAAAAVLLVAPLTLSAGVVYSTDFPDPVNTIPANWTILAGPVGTPGWYMDSGGDFRYDGGPTGIGFYSGPVAGGGASSALSDVTLVTEFRKSTGNLAGFVARAQDASNFYHARLFGTNQLQLYRSVGGALTQIGPTVTTASSYASGQTWRLALTMDGDTLTARVFNQNGVLQGTLTQTDSTYAAGSAGLRATNPNAYESFAIKTPTVLAYEGFSTAPAGPAPAYVQDATIRNTGLARTGFTGNWTSTSAFATSVDYYARSAGLDYGTLITTPGALDAFRTTGTSPDTKSVRRSFDYSFDPEDEIWVSYLFQFSPLGTANGGSAVTVQLAADTDRDLTLNIAPEGTGPGGRATLTGGGSAGSVLDLGVLDPDRTHLLVMRAEPRLGTTDFNGYYDALSVWLDPESLTELGLPDATGFSVVRNQGSTLGDYEAFDELLLTVRPQPAPFSFQFDEFRIGTGASAVLPVPEPATMLLAAMGASALAGYTRRRRRA